MIAFITGSATGVTLIFGAAIASAIVCAGFIISHNRKIKNLH